MGKKFITLYLLSISLHSFANQLEHTNCIDTVSEQTKINKNELISIIDDKGEKFRKLHRNLLRKIHPDTCTDSKETCKATFIEVNRCFEIFNPKEDSSHGETLFCFEQTTRGNCQNIQGCTWDNEFKFCKSDLLADILSAIATGFLQAYFESTHEKTVLKDERKKALD